jgi:hypothetical protein
MKHKEQVGQKKLYRHTDKGFSFSNRIKRKSPKHIFVRTKNNVKLRQEKRKGVRAEIHIFVSVE